MQRLQSPGRLLTELELSEPAAPFVASLHNGSSTLGEVDDGSQCVGGKGGFSGTTSEASEFDDDDMASGVAITDCEGRRLGGSCDAGKSVAGMLDCASKGAALTAVTHVTTASTLIRIDIIYCAGAVAI